MATPAEIDQMLMSMGFDPDALTDEELFMAMRILEESQKDEPVTPIEEATRLRQLGGGAAFGVTEEGVTPSEDIVFSEAEAAEVMREPRSRRERDWEGRVKRVRAEAPEEKFTPPESDAFLKEVWGYTKDYVEYTLLRAPEEPGWEGTLRAAAEPHLLAGTAFGAETTRYGITDMALTESNMRAAGRFAVGVPSAAAGAIAGTFGRRIQEDVRTEALLMLKLAREAQARGSETFEHGMASPRFPGEKFIPSMKNTFRVDDFLMDGASELEMREKLKELQGAYGKWTGLHEEFIQERMKDNPEITETLRKDVIHLFGGLAQLSAQMLGMTVMPSQAKVDDPLDHTILTARMMYTMGEELGPAVIASVGHTLMHPAKNFAARPFTTIIDLLPFYMLAKTGVAAGWLKLEPKAAASLDRVIEYGQVIIEHVQAAEVTAGEALFPRQVGKGQVLAEAGREVARLPVQAAVSALKGARAYTQQWMTDIIAARSNAGSDLLQEVLRLGDEMEQKASAALDYAANRVGVGEIQMRRYALRREALEDVVTQRYLDEYPQSVMAADAQILAATSRKEPPKSVNPGDPRPIADDPGYVYTHVSDLELKNILSEGVKPASSRSIRQQKLVEEAERVATEPPPMDIPYRAGEPAEGVAHARAGLGERVSPRAREAQEIVDSVATAEEIPAWVIENYSDIVGARFEVSGGLPGRGRVAEEGLVPGERAIDWIKPPTLGERRSAASEWAETWTDSTSALPPPPPGGAYIIRAARERQVLGSTASDPLTPLDLTRLDPRSRDVIEAVRRHEVSVAPMEGVEPVVGTQAEMFAPSKAGTYRLNEPVRATELEYLGRDGTWYPVATGELVVRDHGAVGAQAAKAQIYRMVDSDGGSAAIGMKLEPGDAGALNVLMAEMTSQGADTVDAFWMALERVMKQKLRDPRGPIEPPPVPAVVRGGQMVAPLREVGELPPVIVTVFTERGSLSLETGKAGMRPVSTAGQQKRIRGQLERMVADSILDQEFASSVMTALKGEGRFTGTEHRFKGPTPDISMPSVQSRVIPRSAEMTDAVAAELDAFAGSMAKTPEEALLIRQEIDLEISMATLNYLPEIFRSGKLRVGSSKLILKDVLGRLQRNYPEVWGTKTAAQWKRWAFGVTGRGGAAESLGGLLEKASGRIGPLSGEPGSVLPLILDIDIPGTDIKINTVDFANVILNDPKLRKKVYNEAMQQSAIKYGIRKGQEYKQRAFVSKIEEIDGQINRLYVERSKADGTYVAGKTGITEAFGVEDVAHHAIGHMENRGTLPAVLRSNPNGTAGYIETNLDALAEAQVNAQRIKLGAGDRDPRTVLVEGKPDWSQRVINRKTKAAKHRLLNIARELRLYRQASPDVLNHLRVKNTDPKHLYRSKEFEAGHSARDIRKVDIDTVPVDGSIFVGRRVEAALKHDADMHELFKYGGTGWSAANATAKSGATSRNIRNMFNNFGSNMLQHGLSHGDPTGGVIKLFSLGRDWIQFGNGTLARGERHNHFLAGLRTGELNSDFITVETGTAFGGWGVNEWLKGTGKAPKLAAFVDKIHQGVGMAKHEAAWKGTDNLFKLLEMEQNWPVVEGWLDMLGEGRTMELAIGRSRTVKVMKKKGRAGFVDEGGEWHPMTNLQREDLIAKVSIQPGINKYFNFRDVALLPRWMSAHGGGFTLPFYSWQHLALTRAGMGRPIPGLLAESLFGHPYVRTLDPAILADTTKRQMGTMIRLNAMQQAANSNMFPRGEVLDQEAKALMSELSGFNNEERFMLAIATGNVGVDVMDLDGLNFAGPTLAVFRALEAQLAGRGVLEQVGRMGRATADNMGQFMQRTLDGEDAELYGEFSDDLSKLDTGSARVAKEIADRMSTAKRLHNDGHLAASIEAEQQAESLREIAKDTQRIREQWLIAKSGGKFDMEELLAMAGAGGGMLMEFIWSVKEGRMSHVQAAKAFSQALAGGTVTRMWRAGAGLADPSSDWSDRYSWRADLPAPEDGLVDTLARGVLGVALRRVDPYLMATGKHKPLMREIKGSMSTRAKRKAHKIDMTIGGWAKQIDSIEMKISRGDSTDDDRAKRHNLKAAIGKMEKKRAFLIQHARTVISDDWSPVTPWGEKTDEAMPGMKSVLDQSFDAMLLEYFDTLGRAGVEIPQSAEEPLRKMHERIAPQ